MASAAPFLNAIAEKFNMSDILSTFSFSPSKPTGAIVLEDGSVFYGYGFGAAVENVGEICFNTSLTGYQEVLTDPSYAGQIITFTFPHIGNVGVNAGDMETRKIACRGLIVRQSVTESANWRAEGGLDEWLVAKGLSGVYGIDTRALTRRIRDRGAPKGVIVHAPDGVFDIPALVKKAQDWQGLEGLDLAIDVTCDAPYTWTQGRWDWPDGFMPSGGDHDSVNHAANNSSAPHIVAVDFGAKLNILRCLVSRGARVTVVPAKTSAADILALNPDGVFLSNGPGDPAATGVYAVPTIQAILDKGVPLFGICLGHQLLALALGGKTRKMHLGHRGANHPVKDLTTGKVEITSQNHGFCVLPETLPNTVDVTHISLFDGSNEGIRHKEKPAFSVQYHPEASPGPQDSLYLFDRFMDMVKAA